MGMGSISGLRIAVSALVLCIFLCLGGPETGQASFTVKVVGGEDVEKIDDYPWMAALVASGIEDAYDGFFCGGTVMDDRWILTAAHCVEEYDDDWGSLDVITGREDLSNEDQGERISADRIIMHPNYDPDTLDSDLALIYLAEAVDFQEIDIVEQSDPHGWGQEGQEAIILGWGDTERDPNKSDFPDTLQIGNVEIASQDELEDAFGEESITENMIGALGQQNDQTVDTCSGDSGGPLAVQDDNNNHVQVGITSWGVEECGAEDYYGVYARVSKFTDWIEANLEMLRIPDADLPKYPIPGTLLAGTADIIRNLSSDDTRINKENITLDNKTYTLPVGGLKNLNISQVSPGEETEILIYPPLEAFDPDNPKSFVDSEGTAKELVWLLRQGTDWRITDEIAIEVDLDRKRVVLALEESGTADLEEETDRIKTSGALAFIYEKKNGNSGGGGSGCTAHPGQEFSPGWLLILSGLVLILAVGRTSKA